MASFMRPFESQAYALFRIVTGLLFLWHGTQKLFGFPEAMPMDPGPVITYVFVGVSAPLSDEELAVEGARFALERHVEPIGGLGVGLLF